MSEPNTNRPGPPSGPVRLCTASPAWIRTVERERSRLAAALGVTLVRVHHIGSTAIVGIRAKPIVDVLPVVVGLNELDAARERLERIGYHWWGEYGIDRRRYCTLQADTGNRLVNAHFYAQDDPDIARHLAFRDYLRARPDVAREYETVKIRAAELHPDDVNAYNDAKAAWVQSTQQTALAVYRAAR